MTKEQTTRLVRKWQRRLSLRDWRITVRQVAPAQIAKERGPSCVASINVKNCLKAATLTLPTEMKVSDDPIEQTIIHELLHVHIEMGKTRNQREEQAIESIAWALYWTEHPKEFLKDQLKYD